MSVRDAFHEQIAHCEALGSPFMVRLMTLLTARLNNDTAVGAHVLGWEGDPRPGADGLPLRLAGALHALRLEGLALDDVYPPAEVSDDALWSGIEAAFRNHETRILDWLSSPPQTNEVRRSAAILPALAMLSQGDDRPVALYEIGASGGLNLRCDQFRIDVPGGFIGQAESPVRHRPEWEGNVPPRDLPKVVRRGGVDLAPVDPLTEAGRLRLLSYLWADQPFRIDLTEGAIALARQHPAEILTGDAADGLSQLLGTHPPDARPVVFHTIAWQYFPPETKARVQEVMEASPVPVARIAMERDGGNGALVRIWHDIREEPVSVARVGFHGQRIRWGDARSF
ncbi:DUF2332 family protein [Alphaproteobacteria bacterium GH1-50]|uniref:DUF2332 family protein n=1 Tax=Kangsaoukella pontilimi TaxID=2691042 RepID=A0A7C9MWU6_9RHOB|nr:DUF2332 domain-containing protein [Kangsaoukella pontilimi]MXQ08620.1 DUF2332 family protein [Kangsaoukella pontilimi]